MNDLIVSVGERSLGATCEETNPDVQRAVIDELPISAPARRWGDELYVSVPFELAPRETTRQVEPGTLAYWPDGPALCLFWGPTPASVDETPVAASPVAPFAMLDDFSSLSDLEGSETVAISRP